MSVSDTSTDEDESSEPDNSDDPDDGKSCIWCKTDQKLSDEKFHRYRRLNIIIGSPEFIVEIVSEILCIYITILNAKFILSLIYILSYYDMFWPYMAIIRFV
jgi:hypothetical protein